MVASRLSSSREKTAVLPYAAVRTAPDPDRLILDLFEGTYEVGATLAGWDRPVLERPDPLAHRKGVRR